MVRHTLCVNPTILVMPMLAMGLRLHADAVQASDTQQAEQLRKRVPVAKGHEVDVSIPCGVPACAPRALILAACGEEAGS
jgi:hypothetical protein